MASNISGFAQHRILLVNDDGIHAEGLKLAEEIARQFTDDVWVVAPDEEKSGASHSISLSVPIRCRQLGAKRFAVKGTPADCVIVALWDLMLDRPPTLVLSGINHGENLGDDVIYSGTTGAAMESAILGIPSVAFSQVRTLGQVPRLEAAQAFGAGILAKLLTMSWEPGIIVNVNFPDVAQADVSGIRVTKLGRRSPGTFRPTLEKDGRNIAYYWVKVNYGKGPLELDTDLFAIKSGEISMTSLQVDMTSRKFNSSLSNAFNSSNSQLADILPPMGDERPSAVTTSKADKD